MRDALIRIDDETWINPAQVAAVQEDVMLDGRIQVHLKGSNRMVTLVGTQATKVAALLTEELT